MRNSALFAGCIGFSLAISPAPLTASPRISEFMASNDTALADIDGEFSDWIEIHNSGPAAVDLAGHHLTDDPADLTRWTLPPLTLSSGDRLVVFASGKDRTDPAAELHTDFQLDAKGEYLALVAPDGVTILTEFAPFYPPQFEDQSYGNSPFVTPTAQTFVPHAASGRYFVPGDDSLGESWTGQGFDDAPWPSGPSGFGWETAGSTLEPAIATDISATLRYVNATGYFRFHFHFDGTSAEVQSLNLTMQADDGFIAYLNGTEVARDRAPANATWNSNSVGSDPDSEIMNNPPSFDLSAFAHVVTDGDNVLAVQGMNSNASGSDFLVRPLLEAAVQETSGTFRAGYYDSPTPGAPDSPGTATGPIFVEFTDRPDRPAAGTDLAITAKLAGANAPPASAALFYRVMYGAESELAMRDDGAAGDALAGDGIYTATIPGAAFGAGDMLRWRFVAIDGLGFETREPRFPDPLDSHQYVGTAAADPAVQSKLTVVDLFVQNIAAAGTTTGTRGAVFYLGELYDNIFINRHGQSTGGFPKKSYNIDFNKTQRFRWHPDEKRVKDIDLLTNWADKSKVRHVLSYEIMRGSGVAAHFAFTARVQHNGEFYSTADFVEDADDIYLERAGLNPDGALYKVYSNTLSAGQTGNTGVEKKNRRTENNQDLTDFIAGLNSGTLEQQWAFIYDNVNLPMCVNMSAANCVIRNTDMHSKNWYIYRDTGDSDEWGLLPWDLDLAHGRLWNSSETYFDHGLLTDGVVQVGTAVKLVSMMWSRPETRDMMMRRIRTLTDQYLNSLDTPYEQRYFERRLDEQLALIDPPDIVPSDARLDFVKWGSWIEGSGAQQPYTTTHPHIEDMAEGVQRWKDEYLPGRRAYMYNSAGMPTPQSGQLSFTFTPLVSAGAPLRHLVPGDASADGVWTAVGYDDSAWAAGISGLGYDSGAKYLPLIGTDTTATMRGIHPSAYTRIEFEVEDPSLFQALELHMKYDDGFVAYLNGVEVARANAPAAPVWNSTATTSNYEALIDTYETFDISGQLGSLVVGGNVLAVHVMNGTPGSSDLLMMPELHAGSADSNGSIEPRIEFGQIEFKPASNNQDEEFIELVNNNAIAVDVSSWTVAGGVDFAIPPGSVIPAGRSLYLSPNVKTFRARATSPKGGEQRFVVGPYSGHLSNLGELLVLNDSIGAENNRTSYVGEPSDAQLYLVVSELMYHPPGDGLSEFIEILNISEAVTVDLTGVHLIGGVTFDFTGSAITSLAPGERVLVVRDIAAFEAAYGAGLPVAGAFTGGTALSNGGEEIKLEDAENGTVQEFTYDDAPPWPTAADGGGSSLVLIDPTSAPDHKLAANWTATTPRPGLADPTGGFTGDPSADLDGDGLNAFLEHALGSDDSDPQSGRNAFSTNLVGDTARFSYRRNLAAGDITFDVETSIDLSNWQGGDAAGLLELSRVNNGDGTETVTVQHPDPLASHNTRYFRLRVAQ